MDDEFQKLSEIERKEMVWLWEPYIPRGMMTIMEGDPGVSKSYLAMHIAALISSGGTLPNGTSFKRGRVLIFSQEDDPAYTIRPRIEDMGGDLKRVKVHVGDSVFDPPVLDKLYDYVQTWKPDLIIVDPLVGYVGSNVDFFRANEIRPVLRALADIAESVECGLVVIRHLTKGKHDKAIHQGGGSVDFIAFVRSAIRVARHPENDDLRVMVHFKHNLSDQGKSYAYSLKRGRDGRHPTLDWKGVVNLSIDDLNISSRPDHSELAHACAFLKAELKRGPRPAKDLQERADQFGIAKRTLDRAKREVNIVVKKKKNAWEWSLPKA